MGCHSDVFAPGFYCVQYVSFGVQFTVAHGDIAEQSADALVNAAGTSLRMGSGIAGALRREADGPIIAIHPEYPLDRKRVALEPVVIPRVRCCGSYLNTIQSGWVEFSTKYFNYPKYFT